MNLSALFIKRSVMTTLVMVAIAFFGVLAYRGLSVSDLPDVDYPTIQVSVDYPGASPETIANTVVVPLEQQFTTISGIKSISSTSYTGSATIVLQFELNKLIDLAAPDVQAAINAASPQLPQDLPYAPTYSKVNPTSTPILFFVLHSATMTQGDLYDYAHSVIGERINIIEGVSQVQTYGEPFAVRVQVNPQKLTARGIGISQIGTAIQNANVYLPVGTLFGRKKEFTIDVKGQMDKGEEYNPLVMKTDQGAITRLQDIGQAFDSVHDDKIYVKFFKDAVAQGCVGLGVQKQPGANTLATIERINAILPNLERSLPGSVTFYRMYDQSEYITDSVDDVKFTLSVAMLLVIIVIFLYLGKFIDTFIPAIAIPMSMLGTFIVMFFLGYTIDILSLLAITLSIGFLVDDAIVVLENIVRHVEEGKKPLEAAMIGSKEISFTILSMTLCLCTVFIPLVFMEGIVGRILHEFAVTIVTAVAISGFISLTLTPLLCSRLIPPQKEKEKTKVALFSEKFNHKLVSWYKPSLEWALHHRKMMALAGVLSFLLTLYLAIAIPKDFIPGDDIGFVEAFTVAADGTSPFRLADYQDELAKIAAHNPSVESVIAIGGNPQDNEGIMYIRLTDIHKRPPMSQVVAELSKHMNTAIGAQVFLRPVPLINLQVGTTTTKADYQFTMQSLRAEDLYQYAPIMEEKIKSLKGFSQVNSDLDITQPQLKVDILRDKASMLGISAFEIENSLNLAFADSNLSPINDPQNLYYVIMEVLPHYYRDPSKLSQLWLNSASGQLVPLSAIVKMKESLGPLTVNHFDSMPAATVSFNIDGIPLGTGLKNLEKLAKETLPPTVTGSLQGSASVFRSSFANIQFLLLITFFIIYVILGILYEDFFPPFTVMSTLPPAALGGFLSLVLLRETLSLYAVVGVIMLLGIVMKNGIIMIDFANERREKEGMSIHDAIVTACTIRFRPILMTTFSALMGAVPIALGMGGTAAASRKPLGIVIVGGLIVSQVLTLYLTPVTYTYMEALRTKIEKKRKKAAETETSQ